MDEQQLRDAYAAYEQARQAHEAPTGEFDFTRLLTFRGQTPAEEAGMYVEMHGTAAAALAHLREMQPQDPAEASADWSGGRRRAVLTLLASVAQKD